MKKLNREWHLKNMMPKNPTHDQRMRWHVEHSKHCKCHPLSEKLQNEIDEFKNKK